MLSHRVSHPVSALILLAVSVVSLSAISLATEDAQLQLNRSVLAQSTTSQLDVTITASRGVFSRHPGDGFAGPGRQ